LSGCATAASHAFDQGSAIVRFVCLGGQVRRLATVPGKSGYRTIKRGDRPNGARSWQPVGHGSGIPAGKIDRPVCGRVAADGRQMGSGGAFPIGRLPKVGVSNGRQPKFPARNSPQVVKRQRSKRHKRRRAKRNSF